MIRNLKFSAAGLIAVLSLCVFVNCCVRAQIFRDDQPITELQMPPFGFTELKGSELEIKSVEIRKGCSVQIIKWKISRGNFTYTNDQGVVIAGKLSKFTLKGKMSKPDSPCGSLLEIAPGGMKLARSKLRGIRPAEIKDGVIRQ